mgnify:CR=1 FL=1
MFLELARKRRSIRKFKDIEIEKEKLDTLVKSTLLYPSSRSIYPCEFVFVKDKELLGKLAKSKLHGSTFLSGASLGIVVCGDETKSDVWIEDASIASTYIMLSAESLGLGCCWIQIRQRFHSDNVSSEKYVQELLELPENLKVLSIMVIGYPDEEKSPKPDNELGFDKVYINRYNQKFNV